MAKLVVDVFSDIHNGKKLIIGHRETQTNEKLKKIINNIYNVIIYAKSYALYF